MERKPLGREIKFLIAAGVLVLALLAVGLFNTQVRSALSLLSFETPEEQPEPYTSSYSGTLVALGEDILVILEENGRAVSFTIDELTEFWDPISPGDQVRVMTFITADSVEPYPARMVYQMKHS